MFLSDNDDSVVLPDHLRLAPPIDFIPPYTEGQPFRLIFRRTSPFSPAKYFIRFISPLRRVPLPYLIAHAALSIFY